MECPQLIDGKTQDSKLGFMQTKTENPVNLGLTPEARQKLVQERLDQKQRDAEREAENEKRDFLTVFDRLISRTIKEMFASNAKLPINHRLNWRNETSYEIKLNYLADMIYRCVKNSTIQDFKKSGWMIEISAVYSFDEGHWDLNIWMNNKPRRKSWFPKFWKETIYQSWKNY